MSKPASAVQENLHFLINEVELHCQLAEQFFTDFPSDLYMRMCGRRGYIKTLREKVDKECALLIERRKPGTRFYIKVEANRTLAMALDRMALHLHHCIEQGLVFSSKDHPEVQKCFSLVKKMHRAVRLVKLGLDKSLRRTGIKVGRRIQPMLSLYEEILVTIKQQKNSLSGEVLQSAFLTAYCLKEAVDQLSVVGECLIQADLGQVVSLQNYDHLQASADSLNYDLADLKIRRLALTRSGSAIASISHKTETDNGVLAVYKEGNQEKIAEEVAGVKQWQKVDPNVAPDVLAHTDKKNNTSSLLIEHMPGQTLEALLLNGNEKAVHVSLNALFALLNSTWKKTLIAEPIQAKFMAQLAKRIDASRQLHPTFFSEEQSLCGFVRPSFDHLIDAVAAKERLWPAPFSVLTHGDFNVDNLIYDDLEKRIYFIDLHRSQYFDYVQDLSVLMVSIYRLQVLSGETRALMMDSAKQIYQFGSRYAKRHQDSTFELRLAAGLARSFATSTRFIFDKKLASRMHLRARYLLETLANMPSEQETSFKIPLKELYFE
ncbi:phosphotransferase [Marinomonas epiphytica]